MLEKAASDATGWAPLAHLYTLEALLAMGLVADARPRLAAALRSFTGTSEQLVRLLGRQPARGLDGFAALAPAPALVAELVAELPPRE